MSVTQGNLVLGFRLGEVMRDKSPNYAALAVFNAIYGGSINSKLFLK
jgi:predicted Zn-dependent peptidase